MNEKAVRSTTDMPSLRFLGGGIRISATETDGAYCLLEASAHAGDLTPWHIHHDDDEGFYVLSGVLRLDIGEDHLRLGPGDSTLAPRGIPHAWVVESGTPARWLNTSNGGLERFARAVEEASEQEVERLASEHSIELLT